LVADDGIERMVWCKHRFQRQRLNFMDNVYVVKRYGARKRIKEFSNKGWGLRRLNKPVKNLQQTGMTARRKKSRHMAYFAASRRLKPIFLHEGCNISPLRYVSGCVL